MAEQKKAFSLVELVIMVLFLGVLAVVALPRMNFGLISKQKADSTARKIVTDLRRTRSLAISNAAENTAGFALNTGYQIEDLDSSETVDSHTIDSAVTCNGGQNFEFGPLGNLLDGSDSQLTVSANGKTFTIDIVSATGMIKCTES